MEPRGSSAQPEEGGLSVTPVAAAAAAASAAPVTVLGNCARCGSGDRLKFCSRCQAVRYCGPDCQKADVSVARKLYYYYFLNETVRRRSRSRRRELLVRSILCALAKASRATPLTFHPYARR